ncbi:unnamed protein product [Rotaria socialis]
MSWLRDTGAFIVKERYPETDHPFIIRHLLSADALDYYPAHEDMIFNFYDLRKLLLHKQNVLAPVRTLPTLDSIATLSLTAAPPVLTSTQLPTSTTDKTIAMTTYTFAQSLEDLTQNDIRKTIIEGLQRNTAKFTGEHRQDVIKWLKTLEFKFDTADIPTAKKFYLIPQLIDKEALDWFQENKTNFTITGTPVRPDTTHRPSPEHHHSRLLVTNSSDTPAHISEFFCFGYLLSNPVGSQNFFNQIALLCRRYNEKKNQQTFNRTVTHSQLPQRLFNDSKRLYRPTPSIHHVTLNTLPHFSPSQFQQTRDLLVNHLLDRDNKDRLLALLAQFSQLFDNSRHNISNIVVENVFNTVPHSPPSFRPHRNRHHREETQRLIEEFLEAAMIQESNLPYAAPAFIVPRKDNRPSRLVVDYRALNKITIPDVSPLPHMEDLLQELGKGYKYFSRLDLKSGYHQFRIPTADRPKTAFVVSQGHYEFCVLSMGPQNAPAAFQKTMYAVMKSCREFCHVFLDDIIICSKSFDEYINHLKLAFEALAKEKLVLNASKC